MSFPCSRSILAALFTQRLGFRAGFSDLHVPGFRRCTKLQISVDYPASRPITQCSGGKSLPSCICVCVGLGCTTQTARGTYIICHRAEMRGVSVLWPKMKWPQIPQLTTPKLRCSASAAWACRCGEGHHGRCADSWQSRAADLQKDDTHKTRSRWQQQHYM